MSKTTRTLAILAAAAVAIIGANGAVRVIPANTTFTIGGTGADPNNDRNTFIVFEPGSTLVVTQIGTSASIWSPLIATNGPATIRGLNLNVTPIIQNHVFAYGDGSLTLEGMSSASLGHTDLKPVLRIDNLRRGTGVGTLAIKSATVLAFPSDPSVYVLTTTEGSAIRLCGDHDMFPGQDTITIDRAALHLCNPAAIPAGKTVSVAKGHFFQIVPFTVPDFSNGIEGAIAPAADVVVPYATPQTYSCNVSLASSDSMTICSHTNNVIFNGSITGNSTVSLADCKNLHSAVVLGGDNSGFTGAFAPASAWQSLVLSNANAAANATVRMDKPMTLCGADGVASVSVNTVTGGGNIDDFALCAASGQSLAVGAASGSLRVSGGGAGAGSVVTISSLAPDSTVYDDKTATVNLPSAMFSAKKTDGDDEVFVTPANFGLDVSAHTSLTQIPALDAPDGSVVMHGTSSMTVRAAANSEVAVSAGDGDVFSLAGDGAFAVDSLGVLNDAASFWFDFSRANTRFHIGEGVTNAYLNIAHIERVVDWRHPDAVNSLWNRRYYKSGYEYAESVYPYVASDTQNGLQYITMAGAGTYRRLPFSDGHGYNTMTSCVAQLVVMVFGAQNGGGYAMIATPEGAFGRAGTKITHGITTNTMHDIWQDGVKIADPTTAKFKNGWQVMSVALDGLRFAGLGFLKDLGGDRGGQNYGEVLLFTNAVSERVRLEAEWYLAKKWGLSSQYDASAKGRLDELRAANPLRVDAVGAPTIRIGENAVDVGGRFSGTVELAGGRLVVPERSLPRTDADIPSEGRLYWADPDDEATLLRYKDLGRTDSASRPDEVRAIKDKSAREFAVGQLALYGVGGRMPYLVRQSRGLGPERGWLDFNNRQANDTDGNCLRFFNYPSDSAKQTGIDAGNSYSDLLANVPVRTAFFVTDSVRGGGNPLLRTVAGDYGTTWRSTGKWTERIWINDRPTAFGTGENRLDSRIVDHRNGFSGKPEVFTLRGTDSYNAPFIGCYQNSEGVRTRGEIFGEILLYSTALSDDDVKGIEAYLMGKWLGRLPDGYADIRNATVTGSGTVDVAVAAQMPTIGQGFEGTVKVDDGAFVMTVDVATGAVSSSLDSPLATLDLPQNCSITLNFTERPPHPQSAVTYTLVNCASGMEGVSWTFTSGANAPSAGVFIKSGNTILYRYAPRGMVFSFR